LLGSIPCNLLSINSIIELNAPTVSGKPKKSIRGRVRIDGARSPNRSDFIFGPPVPSLRTVVRTPTAYESRAEPNAPITAALSVVRPERT